MIQNINKILKLKRHVEGSKQIYNVLPLNLLVRKEINTLNQKSRRKNYFSSFVVVRQTVTSFDNTLNSVSMSRQQL